MSSAGVVKRYFEAIAARDLAAPDGVRAQLGELHGAFPDPVTGDVKFQLERAASS